MPSSSIGALHQLLGWDSFAESRLSPREKHKQVFSVAQISLMMTRFTTVSQSDTPQEHLASDYKKIWRINEAKFFSHGILLESIVFAFVLPEVFWMQQTHSNSQITFYRFAAGLDNKADSGSDYRVEEGRLRLLPSVWYEWCWRLICRCSSIIKPLPRNY